MLRYEEKIDNIEIKVIINDVNNYQENYDWK